MNSVTNAINTHGLILKKAVRNILEQTQGVEILNEEHPVNYLEGTSIDLLVEIQTDKNYFIVPLECKRALKSIKRWLFFPDPTNYSKILFFFKENNSVPQAHHAGFFQQLGITICMEGIEVISTSDKKANISYKADPTPIWEAANQICRGSHGFVIEEMGERNKTLTKPLKSTYIFPIIVTSAQLSLAQFEKTNINFSEGFYEGDLPEVNLKWVILNHPFTVPNNQAYQKLGINNSQYEDIKTRGMNLKQGIMVVNIEYLEDFVRLLNRYNNHQQ